MPRTSSSSGISSSTRNSTSNSNSNKLSTTNNRDRSQPLNNNKQHKPHRPSLLRGSRSWCLPRTLATWYRRSSQDRPDQRERHHHHNLDPSQRLLSLLPTAIFSPINPNPLSSRGRLPRRRLLLRRQLVGLPLLLRDSLRRMFHRPKGSAVRRRRRRRRISRLPRPTAPRARDQLSPNT